MARVFRRHVGTMDFEAGSTKNLKLPRNHVFRGMFLTFRGALTTTGGTNSGTVGEEAPYSLIRRLRVIRNGSETIMNVDGGVLSALMKVAHGTVTPFLVPSGGVVASGAVEFDLSVDFAALGMAKETITLLRGVGTTSLELEITWGNGATLFDSDNDRTHAIDAGAVMHVTTTEIMDISGNYADRHLSQHELLVTASGTNLTFDLPLGNLYRRVYVKATHDGGTTLTNDLINKLSLRSDGNFSHFDTVRAEALQGINKIQYGLETELLGYYIIDLVEDGRELGLIDTSGASQFSLTFDVTHSAGVGDNKIVIIPEVFIPSQAAQ